MYDIFFILKDHSKIDLWHKCKKKYPRAQLLTDVVSYNEIKSRAFTRMFWAVWDDVILQDDFDLNSYTVTKWDNMYIHVFKNQDSYDGICLFSKDVSVSDREFNYRFFTSKKEVDIIASFPTPQIYDIIFISFDELIADENYKNLIQRFPRAKRIHGIKGIHQAHVEAAKLSDTDLFYVVDADAVILEDFNFDYHVEPWNKDSVHVWKSINPINQLEYGYGGVKLLPKKLTSSMNVNTADMTTSISKKFKNINKVSNITGFNIDEFSTWKSAFRECVKLSSKIIDRQQQNETDERLNIWCSAGSDKPFGKFAVLGAIAGKEYGSRNKNDLEKIKKINDFNWLKEYYEIQQKH